MNANQRYQQHRSVTEPRNKARRAKRHTARMERQRLKRMKVARGTARQVRRQNMDLFRRQRDARLGHDKGTIRVNAPSLEMLGKYIGRVPTKLDNLDN